MAKRAAKKTKPAKKTASGKKKPEAGRKGAKKTAKKKTEPKTAEPAAPPPKKPEYLGVNIDAPRKYRWSTGKWIGKTYREAQENRKIVANRCPECKEVLWPPLQVCGRCKVDAGEDWVELSQTGTVMQYTYLVYPLWDPHYGEKFANPYPNAMILLDDGVYIRHFLEETDKDKLKVGMRVQAVWREEAERGEGTADIKYFRTIDG